MALIVTKGTGTIVWGTGGILSAPAGSIVDSLQLTPKNAEPIEIEDGAGLAVFEVLLRDGFNAKATLMFDATKSYPVEGANCGLAIPLGNGATNAAYHFGESTVNGATVANGVATYTCLVASISPAYKKKGEAMFDVSLTYRPQVAV